MAVFKKKTTTTTTLPTTTTTTTLPNPYDKNDHIKYVHLSWLDVEDACLKIFRQMSEDDYQPESIVALLRGGVIPARIFSDYFNSVDEITKENFKEIQEAIFTQIRELEN